MNINIEVKDPNSTSMTIEGEMTIYTINELQKSLSENLNTCSELNIYLSMVSRIDTSGFQLLLLAKKEAEKKDISIKFLEPSQEVEHIFNLYGESC